MAGAAAPVVAAAVLVAPLFATSAEAARPQATTTQTVTTTVTVTAPAETVTVTQAPVTTTVTVTATSATTTAPPATTSSTTSPTSTATAGACPVGGANKPGAADPWGGCFPGPGNTGIPAGTVLTDYTGPYVITTANTKLDKIRATQRIIVRATGVTITNSSLAGITGESGWPTITDSFIQAADDDWDRTVGGSLTVQRSEIKSGLISNGAGWCADGTGCTITDNWIHNDIVLPSTSTAHMSAWRQNQSTFLQHNTLACEAQPSAADGGCSADLTGYGDFAPVQNNTMRFNLFVANPTGVAFCAYGGSSPGKPYSNDAHDIVFDRNVFQRGSNRACGAYGPIDSFDPTRPGSQWTGNVWDDGAPITIADVG